ncbi:lanthionine synthetase LanC family protein [Streptomyces sp. B6B3]|uniref:class III lanthionine synthetase LanKC N-terminal domain-containing protein n=1 Tax=Streptomyces sp. B6B3 TaxID=3153570 RepID=UPI00325C690F
MTDAAPKGWQAEALVRQHLAALDLPEPGPAVHVGTQWTSVAPHGVPIHEHGWKLHVSSRSDTFPRLAARLLPVLLAERHHFKIARSETVLAIMNHGRESPATVGKAVTVYPAPDQVRRLGLALAELLRGHEGPRVLSDRRVAEDAPVYYRFGPFAARWYAGEHGALGIRIAGPAGEWFEAGATMEYRQPAWTSDPFTERHADDGGTGENTMTLGGRFRVTQGIYQAAQGNVYRAEDTDTGRPVVVKQARAHVGEGPGAVDARTRLRNERRILHACEGVAGVPEFVDHFAHGPDEYLVTSDVGERNLLQHVRLHGVLQPPGHPAPTEAFATLAARLAATVLALHERGVIVRDLTPRNVVLGPGGQDRPDALDPCLIDFGLTALDGVFFPGGTPGFAPPRQLAGEEPRPDDDAYALGMILGFAATGMVPLPEIKDVDLARRRMLQALADQGSAAPGSGAPSSGPPDGLLAAIEGLLSGDGETADRVLRALASGRWHDDETGDRDRPGRDAGHTPPPPPRTAPRAMEARVLDIVLAEVGSRQLDSAPSEIGAVDANLYTGSAGVGLELLHHLERPGVPEVVERLAAHAHAATRRIRWPEGLLAGTTGIELFLARARAAGLDVPAVERGTEPEPNDDLFSGVAGLALGHLLLSDVTGDLDQLAVARAHAERLASPDAPHLTVDPDAPGLPAGAGVDPTVGYAHGRAGILDALVGTVARTGDAGLRDAARLRARELAKQAEPMIEAALAPTAVPITASWCQGLSGAARALVHAGSVLAEPECTRVGRAAADACAAWIPRMENLSQCCGACGVGSMLIDVAVRSGEERHWEAAHRVARHLMTRSHGPDDAPRFIPLDGQDAPLSFGMGYAGVLTFLRRLNRRGDPDLLSPVITPVVGPVVGPG